MERRSSFSEDSSRKLRSIEHVRGYSVQMVGSETECTAQRMSGALLYFLEISPSCLSVCERTE